MPGAPSCADIIADAVAHLGPRLAHVTAAENVPHIRAHGLWPAAEVARRAGIDPATILLRRDRLKVGQARLNHQRPFLAGINAARVRLVDHGVEAWAAQLDERVYFFPARKRDAFHGSFELATDVLWLDTAGLLAAAFDRIDLCALNSGSFRQIPTDPARTSYDRDLSIYRPLAEGISAFRSHRRDTGRKKGLDDVKEVSLRGGLDPDTLAGLICGPPP
ncbi:MAG: hypothetical protein AAGL96_02995 [Pseudomonadota bacterium]